MAHHEMGNSLNSPPEPLVKGMVTGRPATPQEVAYRDGYVTGRTAESYLQDQQLRLQRQQQRTLANSYTTNGVFLGVSLFLFAVLVGGAVYFAGNNEQPTIQPQPSNTSTTPAAPEAPDTTTIIDRTIERTRDVVPSAPPVVQPQVDINMPTPAESAQPQAPAPTTTPSTAPTPEAEAQAAPEAAAGQ